MKALSHVVLVSKSNYRCRFGSEMSQAAEMHLRLPLPFKVDIGTGVIILSWLVQGPVAHLCAARVRSQAPHDLSERTTV